MTEEAKKARAEYNRAYREANRQRIRETSRKWQQENPDKMKEYRRRYWEKKALEAAAGASV